MEKEKTKKNTEEVEEAADSILNSKSNGNSSKGSNSASGGEDSEDKSSIFSLSHIKLNCRNTVSKYDFVKVSISFFHFSNFIFLTNYTNIISYDQSWLITFTGEGVAWR